MSVMEIEEMGPIDYIVLEWPGRQPDGSVAPLIIDLVDRGIIRIIDIAVMVKDEEGQVAALDLAALEGEFSEFEGASTGLLDQEDLDEAAAALEPGTSAAVLVWENRWAAPFASALFCAHRQADAPAIRLDALDPHFDSVTNLDNIAW